MKVGDLVYWSAKPSLLGIVIEATKQWKHGGTQACRVLWANGVESNHSTSCFKKVETSENT
jgi:hypothetical protein